MHYYGTYAIARVAGLKPKDAKVIAYSAQFVDDSAITDNEIHRDGGLLSEVATAHHPLQAGEKHLYHKIIEKLRHRKIGNIEQRTIWIPFHFYPGNEGDTLSEKLICRKNSALVNEMFENHIKHTKDFSYILQLIGIAAHVYMDTFSHYGFLGMSSRKNKVNSNSFIFDNNEKNHKKAFSDFNKKYKKEYFKENWRNKSRCISICSSLARIKIPFLHKLIHKLINFKISLKSDVAEFASGALGHGAVATFPDQPYLKWSFSYESSNEISNRNNPQTFLEGCEHLYIKLRKFSDLYYSSEKPKHSDFSKIKKYIKEILSFYGDETKRVDQWIEYIRSNKLFDTSKEEFLHYNATEWENQKMTQFHSLQHSAEMVNLPIYKFHQATDYHRHYTLKQLLPKYGIIVN